MAKPKRKPAATYADLPIADWNVGHHLAWLVAETKRRFDVDYTPGGRGPISQAWARERGMLKQAQGKLGNVVLHAFIAQCLDSYRPTAQYPAMTFTLMWTYRQGDIARVQAQVKAEERATARRQASDQPTVEISDAEFDELI